jgi:hypothetical protein
MDTQICKALARLPETSVSRILGDNAAQFFGIYERRDSMSQEAVTRDKEAIAELIARYNRAIDHEADGNDAQPAPLRD